MENKEYIGGVLELDQDTSNDFF